MGDSAARVSDQPRIRVLRQRNRAEVGPHELNLSEMSVPKVNVNHRPRGWATSNLTTVKDDLAEVAGEHAPFEVTLLECHFGELGGGEIAVLECGTL